MELTARTTISVPLVDAEQALMHPPADWLPHVRARDRWQWHPNARVSLGEHLAIAHKRVRFEFGALHPGPGASVPFRWRPVGLTWILPVMHGILTLSIDGTGTALTLQGQYTPPLGSLGRWLDRVLLHRFSQRTADDLLAQIAARIRTLVATDRARREPRRASGD